MWQRLFTPDLFDSKQINNQINNQINVTAGLVKNSSPVVVRVTKGEEHQYQVYVNGVFVDLATPKAGSFPLGFHYDVEVQDGPYSGELTFKKVSSKQAAQQFTATVAPDQTLQHRLAVVQDDGQKRLFYRGRQLEGWGGTESIPKDAKWLDIENTTKSTDNDEQTVTVTSEVTINKVRKSVTIDKKERKVPMIGGEVTARCDDNVQTCQGEEITFNNPVGCTSLVVPGAHRAPDARVSAGFARADLLVELPRCQRAGPCGSAGGPRGRRLPDVPLPEAPRLFRRGECSHTCGQGHRSVMQTKQTHDFGSGIEDSGKDCDTSCKMKTCAPLKKRPDADAGVGGGADAAGMGSAGGAPAVELTLTGMDAFELRGLFSSDDVGTEFKVRSYGYVVAELQDGDFHELAPNWRRGGQKVDPPTGATHCSKTRTKCR